MHLSHAFTLDTSRYITISLLTEAPCLLAPLCPSADSPPDQKLPTTQSLDEEHKEEEAPGLEYVSALLLNAYTHKPYACALCSRCLGVNWFPPPLSPFVMQLTQLHSSWNQDCSQSAEGSWGYHPSC